MAGSREKSTVSGVLNKLIERNNSNMRRLRILEQEASINKTMVNSVEEELLSLRNFHSKVLQELGDRLSKTEESLFRIETLVKELSIQVKKSTSPSRIKELEELIEIYNPIKSQFVTREEVSRIIDEKLKS